MTDEAQSADRTAQYAERVWRALSARERACRLRTSGTRRATEPANLTSSRERWAVHPGCDDYAGVTL